MRTNSPSKAQAIVDATSRLRKLVESAHPSDLTVASLALGRQAGVLAESLEPPTCPLRAKLHGP
jgi:hypothetical protein